MQNIVIDNKKKEIRFQDQNKNIVNLLRFIFGLNILNSGIFFLLFNNQDDVLKWIWLVFALMNIYFLYFSLTRLSKETTVAFRDIESVEIKGVFGVVLKLKDAKYRKVFIPRDASIVKSLQDRFSS